jgi:hypothetical protein
MILHELQGKETARHKGGTGREGKKELTGGEESSDELTRTKTEQTEEEEGVGVRCMRKRRGGGGEEGEEAPKRTDPQAAGEHAPAATATTAAVGDLELVALPGGSFWHTRPP